MNNVSLEWLDYFYKIMLFNWGKNINDNILVG